jgi:hypothetical protein
MSIYNFEDNTEKAVMHYLSHLPKELEGKVKLYHNKIEMNKDFVYVLLLK